MEKIDLGLIAQDATVDPKVAEVYEILKDYKDAKPREDWISRRTEAWDAIENQIIDDKTVNDMKKAGQMPLQINKVVKGVQGQCAMVTDQKPQIQFLPVGSGDLFIAELLKRRFDLIWEKNEGNDTAYEMVEEAAIGAHGFISAKLDKSKSPWGRVTFECEPPEDIYWDKDSKKRDYSDTNLIKAKQRNRQYIKENYGDLSDNDIYFNPGLTKEELETKSSGITTGDNYAEGKNDEIQPDVKAKQKIIWEIEAWLLKTQDEDWLYEIDQHGEPVARVATEEEIKALPKGVKTRDQLEGFENTTYYWKRKVTKRIQRIIVGKKLVSEEANPYGTDADGEPVIHLIGLKTQKTRSSYCMSPTNYALPLNREKIKRRAQAIYAVSQQSNAPIVRPAGKTTWKGEPGTPGSELLVDPNVAFQPYRLESAQVDAVRFLQLEQQTDAEIDDCYNLHDVMKGKMPEGQSQIAGRTVLALQDFGGLMNKPFLRSIESSLVRLAKIVMALILEVSIRREDWERLLEEDEKTELNPYQQDQQPEELDEQGKMELAQKWDEAIEILMNQKINVIDLDVKIIAGSSMPTNRMAKLQVAMDMYAAQLVDRQYALEYADDPKAKQVSKRMDEKEAQMAQAGMLKK